MRSRVYSGNNGASGVGEEFYAPSGRGVVLVGIISFGVAAAVIALT